MKHAVLAYAFRATPILILTILSLTACKGPLHPDITENDLKYHLGILSSDAMEGRMTGKGIERARDYIVQAYRQAGLHPVFPDYRMPFIFHDGMQATGTNAVHIEGRSFNTIPLPFGNSKQVQAILVDGGHCMPPYKGFDELAHIEKEREGTLQGSILVCRRYGPEGPHGSRPYRKLISFHAKYENAKRFEPAAVIFLKGSGEAIQTEQLHGGRAKSGPPVVFSVHDEELLQAAQKNVQARLDVRFAPRKRTGFNLVASLRPITKDQRIIYAGAHYDHLGHGLPGSSMGPMGPVYNGADDNASGTALILELAAAMKAKLDANPALLPADVNVVFINFDAEERGLFGSSHFVESEFFKAHRTIAMLNADMVGRLRKSRGLTIQGRDTADPSLQAIIEKAYASTVQRIFPPEERPELRWMKGGMGPSDHSPFYRKKVPVVFLFTGTHGEYHRPEDDYALINFKGLYALTLFSEQIIRRLAFAPPVFQQAPEEPQHNSFDFKVRLGIIPGSYDTGTPGLLVGGIVSGAPIARTGIKEGDRIVELGSKKIQDIHDLMGFLSEARLGVRYSVKWLRDGRMMEGRTELMPSDD